MVVETISSKLSRAITRTKDALRRTETTEPSCPVLHELHHPPGNPDGPQTCHATPGSMPLTQSDSERDMSQETEARLEPAQSPATKPPPTSPASPAEATQKATEAMRSNLTEGVEQSSLPANAVVVPQVPTRSQIPIPTASEHASCKAPKRKGKSVPRRLELEMHASPVDASACTGPLIIHDGHHGYWEAEEPVVTIFEKISLLIKAHLEKTSEPTPEYVFWAMYMIGKSKDVVYPTILICSESETHRKYIRKIVKKSQILAAHPDFLLAHQPRMPGCKHRLVPMASESRDTGEKAHPASDNIQVYVLASAGTIVSGSALYIQVDSESTTFQKASVGTILSINGQTYVMTAAHAFAPSAHPVGAEPEDESRLISFSDSEDDDEILVGKVTAHAEIDPRGGLAASQIEGTPLNNSPEKLAFVLTRNEPHDLRRIGKLLFSSYRDSPNPELDYAIIKLHNDESLIRPSHMFENLWTEQIKGPWVVFESYMKRVRLPYALASTYPGEKVFGSLHKSPTYIRSPETRIFQAMYGFNTSPGSLVNGDCGAGVYVWSSPTCLLGHIVLGSSHDGLVYIVPADSVARDFVKEWEGSELLGAGPIL